RLGSGDGELRAAPELDTGVDAPNSQQQTREHDQGDTDGEPSAPLAHDVEGALPGVQLVAELGETGHQRSPSFLELVSDSSPGGEGSRSCCRPVPVPVSSVASGGSSPASSVSPASLACSAAAAFSAARR